MNDSPPIITNSPAFEYVYVANQRCDCGGRFAAAGQELRNTPTGPVDRITGRCAACSEGRIFDFDISSFFGQFERYDLFRQTDAHFQEAMVHVRAQQWEEAEAALRRVIDPEEGEPAFAWAHFHLGAVLLCRGRAEEAVAQLETAALIQPLEADIHEMLGNACQGAGRVAEARIHVERAQELRERFQSARE
jgi:tetratricopeptide (TPR) repeat protein